MRGSGLRCCGRLISWIDWDSTQSGNCLVLAARMRAVILQRVPGFQMFKTCKSDLISRPVLESARLRRVQKHDGEARHRQCGICREKNNFQMKSHHSEHGVRPSGHLRLDCKGSKNLTKWPSFVGPQITGPDVLCLTLPSSAASNTTPARSTKLNSPSPSSATMANPSASAPSAAADA